MSLQNDYTKSHPLDIRFLNQDHENVLYISDEVQSLSIEITNISDEPIQFNDPAGQSTDDFYHIQLNFKPETLDTSNKLALAASDNWSMGTVETSNGVSVPFQLSQLLVLEPSAKTTINLSNLNADSTLGARVTQVQINADQICYESDTSKMFQFSNTAQLSIINQRGKQNIPLHFGFAGSNTILNDGESASSLLLQITNTAKESQSNPTISDITFNCDSDTTTKSYITLSFTSEETNLENALATKDQLSKVSVVQPTNWATELDDQTDDPLWTVYPASETQLLASGSFLDIQIDNIITNASTGMTYLKVSYFNIPGYWDGDILVPIMKQPLVMRTLQYADGTGSGSQVGVGVMPAVAELTIDGDTRTDNNLWVEGHVKANGRVADQTGAVMPVGGIIMWSGLEVDIPEGWVLCDGENGTPDLRDRFVAGAGGNTAPDTKGGTATITVTENNLPPHNHEVTVEGGAHQHTLYADGGSGGSGTKDYDIITVSNFAGSSVDYEATVDSNNSEHTHDVTVGNTGSGAPISILPPFYALCFIMKQ